MWLRGKDAAEHLGVSRDTIERRAVPWKASSVPHRIRYKMLALDEESEPVRRYYLPDLEAMLRESVAS